MKTNFHFLPALACRATPRLSWVTRLWIAARPFFAVLCASLITILAAPAAWADGPAGEYKFVSSTGSISVGSASIPLPQKEIRDKIAILRTGRIVIEDGKVLLDHKMARFIIRRIFQSVGRGIAVDTTIKGPTSIPLHRNGQVYIGTTDWPLVVTLDATADDEDFRGHWKNQFTAKVRGDTLKLTISMSGRIVGKKLSGIIVATCKRDTGI